MTSSPQYSFGGFNAADYYSIMNNPYFLAAMQTANPNFKASQTSETQAAQAAASVQTGNDGAIPVVSSSQQSADGGSNFVTGALATVLIGGGALWALKSGKFSQAGKVLKSLTGRGEKTTTALASLRAVKNGNGDLKIQVPNKIKTFSGNNVQNGVNEYGIKSSIDAARQAYNPQISAVRSFQYATPADSYTVIIKDGKIVKVVSALMKKDEDVLARLVNAESKSTDAELLSKFKKVVEELGKDSKEVDKSVFKDVANIRYSNKYGDDTLNMVMKKYDGKAPILQSFRTLEQFDRTSEAVKSHVPTSAEEVFAGDLVNQTGGWFNKKGVLVDGVGVLKCEENLAGAKCFFEGGNLVKIKIGNVEYPSNSIGYKEFIKDNKEVIEQFQKDVFEDKIASKIPTGAIIGTV